jgi:sugar phosphate isomerase/epimerase
LETHGGLINNGVEGAALLRRLGAPALKLTYDMANVVYYGGVLPQEDLAQMGEDIGRFVGHVHLKDKANRKLREYQFPVFGAGILDFSAVLELLNRGGYRGAMAVEVELDGAPQTPEIVDSALVQSLAYLERL